MTQWNPDLLPGYEATDLALPEGVRAAGEPDDVALVATLVRRIHAGDQGRRPALLYVHGWNDYFFQTHLADAVEAMGYAFYALDLRRYGRSLRRGQLPGFITDLDEYHTELDAAADLIAAQHDGLLAMGHSTGGLVTALWAAARPGRLRGLVLNSPWLDLQGSALVRTLGSPLIDALGSRNPTSVLRLPPDLGFYARALHSSLEGEWDYDLELKVTPSPPIRAGWLRAILAGHQRVAAGLGIDAPVLVLASGATDFARRWHEGLRTVDSVLDVEQIAARAVRLGGHLTLVRIPDGMHDLVLSAPDVRARTLDEIARWTAAYAGGTSLPVPPTA
ncbi:alpha/beta hydrolase [uncultured Friedmanniella sp.]|uniref:alpha/beta hydrolase n=1 Tax=uncultured Friedmanniella sp. TaxID=335381 RepID=UPI0035C94673